MQDKIDNMNLRTNKLIIAVVILLMLLGVGRYFLNKNAGVANIPNGENSDTANDIPPEPSNNTSPSLPGFKVPEGFSLNIFAKNIPGARVMALDGFGNMWVSQTNEGTITTLYIKDGVVKDQHVVFKNLDKPHGLVIDNNFLYFAEETKITRVALYSDDSGQKIADLPEGGSHFTRTLLVGPDDRLYVSIGSTCHVCQEKDERLGSIYSMKKDGSDFKQVARGLRNSVFMATNPVDGKIYATEMGRDNLGDNVPPDEINIIGEGNPSISLGVKNFGWPICYGKNIHDTDFDTKTYIRNPCME